MKKFFPHLLVFLFSLNAIPSIATFEVLQKNRIITNEWQAKYAGETMVDNIPVLAVLESSQKDLSLPLLGNNSILPQQPVYKKIHRLSIISTAQPEVRVSIALKVSKISTEKGMVNAYVSEDPSAEFQVTIYEKKDSTLHVFYRRKISLDKVEENTFTLNPLVTTL